MKTIVLNGFGGTENFKQEEINIPEFGDNEVLIRIKAAAFNPIDHQMRRGERERELMIGNILGIEFSGIVEKTGAAVIEFKEGDEVLGCSIQQGSNGTYAEYIAISSSELIHKPANISLEEAASLPIASMTAWLCVKRMGWKSGESVFINGASGGVGRFLLVLFMRYHPDAHVVVVAGNPESISVLKSLGLPEERIIDYHTPDLEKVLLSANGGRFYDHVVDLVGSTISETTAKILAINGNYLDVTLHGTQNTREILFDKAATVMNIAAYAEIQDNGVLNSIAELISTQQITVPEIRIIGPISVETVSEAHQLMEKNQTNGRKLVMTM